MDPVPLVPPQTPRRRIFPRCTSLPLFLFFFCLYLLTLSAISFSLFQAAASSLETRYGLSSVSAGWLSTANRCAYLVVVVPLAFIGSTNKLRLLIGSAFLAGISSLVFVLPHFLGGKYNFVDTGDNAPLCPTTTPWVSSCHDSGTSYYWVFVLARIGQGIAAPPAETLVFPLLDDIVPREKKNLYIALFSCMYILGPVLGYGLSGVTLNMWVDLGNAPAGATPSDQNWVGAWWIAFILFGFLGLLAGIPLMFFSEKDLMEKELARRNTLETYPVSEAKPSERAEDIPLSKLQFAALVLSIKELLRNRSYVLYLLGDIVGGFPLMGVQAWGAKFIQSIFFVTPAVASFAVAMLIPVGFIGIALGGWWLHRIQARAVDHAKWNLIFTAIGLLFLVCLLIGCGNIEIAGVNTDYTNFNQIHSGANTTQYLGSPCNNDCACDSMDYAPVCGSDGVTYFTPCHAGCETKSDDDYYSCSCIVGSSSNSTSSLLTVEGFGNGTATDGPCQPEGCTRSLVIYILLFLCGLFWVFASNVPKTQFSLNIVQPQDRAMALAFDKFLTVALNDLPVPVVYGAVLDRGCILKDQACEGDQNCLEYDSWKLRISIFLFTSTMIAASLVFFFLSFQRAKAQSHFGDEPLIIENVVSDSDSIQGDRKDLDQDRLV